MMVADRGIEAAVREVAKLLLLPELLASIFSNKSDYITRQQVNFEDTCKGFLEVVKVVQECREIYLHSFVDGHPPKAGSIFPKVEFLEHSKGSLWRKLT